jgi:hypothetical protein
MGRFKKVPELTQGLVVVGLSPNRTGCRFERAVGSVENRTAFFVLRPTDRFLAPIPAMHSV